MSDVLPKVELHPGYWFTCEKCGQDTHGRMVVVTEENIDAETKAELEANRRAWAEQNDGMETGIELLARPTIVKCQHCGESFEADGDESAFEERF